MYKLFKKLENPPKEYRAVPFWSWNDKLTPEMLRWQIQEMDKVGLGGYFMHARGGLETEYLSEEWMNCIEICIDEGNKYGMGSWCYDEEGWPSGFAGGRITAMGDKFHMRWIELEKIESKNQIVGENILGIYILEKNTNQLKSILLQEVPDELDTQQELLIIKHLSNPYYIDILNEDVIRVFLEVTHEVYYERFHNEFGKGLLGFFTDEPQFSREHIPWSYILPEKFEEKYGYNMNCMLPALFIECEGYEKFRYDYWGLISELFTKSFGEQIYNWCEEHQCKLTGHAVEENTFLWQMYCCAGVMPFYEYLHIPGMDWLSRKIDSPLVPKQVSSVANQLGKKFVLSETFALCGWDVSFEELKWIAEWQYVNGVNWMCQHLEGYTLRGLRKRDYPPSLFYQQSWWNEYKLFNDYFARLGVLLTSGVNVANVLLIHPMKSAWIYYNFTNHPKLQKLNDDFVKVSEHLSGAHIDYHYGDETIMFKHARVEGAKLIVGQCQYTIVILPPMLTIDKNTAKLLMKFIENGGCVISIEQFPKLLDGGEIKEIDNILDHLRNKTIHLGGSKEELYEKLKSLDIINISIKSQETQVESIHYQQRDLGDSQVFYMVNHDQFNTFETEICIKGKWNVQKYCAEISKLYNIDYKHENNNTKVSLKFLPMQSHIIIVDNKNTLCENIYSKQEKIVELPQEWNVQKMDYNSLTLDYCYYSIDNKEWIGPIHTIQLMKLLLEKQQSLDISLKFEFNIDFKNNLNKKMFLAIEKANEFDIYINEKQIKYEDIGWWKDSSFKKINIKPYIKQGLNEVILKRHFYQDNKVYEVLFGKDVLESEKNKLTFDVELESIYVVGDFGVVSNAPYSYGEKKAIFTEGPFTIVDQPKKVKSGNLTEQGYCFFAGSISLNNYIQVPSVQDTRIILNLKRPNSSLVKIWVNNKLVETRLWEPYKVDITDSVKEGLNEITLELFASNRNLLGPHHHIDGELYVVGPFSFEGEPAWGDKSGESKWIDRYCFVSFGL